MPSSNHKNIPHHQPNPSPASPPKNAQSNWEERYQDADIPERHRQPKHPQRLNFASFFLTFIACFVCVLLIFSYTRITVLNDQIAKEKDILVSLQNEAVKLNAEYESRYDLSEIELYAQEELGMTKMDSSQIEYVEIGIPDTITHVTGTQFSFAVIEDTIVSLINSILSWFS